MAFEDQTSPMPTTKALVAAVMTLVVYHFSAQTIPVDVLGAWAVLIHYGISVIGGLASAYPFRDRAGKPLEEPQNVG